MNINELYTSEAHEDGAEFNIIHPVTGKPTNAYIKVAGPDSRLYRKAEKDMLKANIPLYASKDDNTDQLIDIDAEFLAKITIDWRGISSDADDNELKFSFSEAKKLYLKSPFVRDQVNAFSKTRGNFTNGQPKSLEYMRTGTFT